MYITVRPFQCILHLCIQIVSVFISSLSINLFSYSYIISNLESARNYTLIVATRTDVPQDPTANITMPLEPFTLSPPGPVTNIVLDATRTLIEVTWSPPEGSINYHSLLTIVSYRIEIVLADDLSTKIVDEDVSADVLVMEYSSNDGVLPGTAYNVDVSARNAVGKSMRVSSSITTDATGKLSVLVYINRTEKSHGDYVVPCIAVNDIAVYNVLN